MAKDVVEGDVRLAGDVVDDASSSFLTIAGLVAIAGDEDNGDEEEES